MNTASEKSADRYVILVVDQYFSLFQGVLLDCRMIADRIISTNAIITPDPYNAPSSGEIEAVIAAQNNPAVDLIIVGHNMGGGLSRVRAISPNNRSKVLVVGNTSPEDQEKYQRLGVNQFLNERATIIQWLEAHLSE